MKVLACNDTTTRNNIQSVSKNYNDDGTIKSEIKFVLSNGTYYVGLEILDEPEFSHEIIRNYATDENNWVDFPITAPVVNDFDDISITDDVVYAPEDFINLGRLATGTVLQSIYTLKKPNGDRYIIVMYRNGQVSVIDVQNNTYNYLPLNNQCWKPLYHHTTNTIIFFGVLKLFRYSIDTEEFNEVVLSDATSGLQDRCLGLDDAVYSGTQKDARVYKYVPETNSLTQFSQVDSTPDTYIYALGGDSGYMYLLLRNSGNYRIVLLNQSNNNKTSHKSFSDEYKGGDILLYQDTASGDKFYQCRLYTSQSQADYTVNFKDGVVRNDLIANTLLTPSHDGSLVTTSTPGQWPTNYQLDIDTALVEGINNISKISYKDTSDSVYAEIEMPEVDGEDLPIKTIDTLPNGNIIFAMTTYGPIGIFDTQYNTVEVHPYSGVSVYDVMGFDDDNYFISGYVASTHKWNHNNAFNFGVNPVQIPVAVGNSFYHNYLTKSGDWVYISELISRNDYGSAVCMYNVATGQSILMSSAHMLTLKNYNAGHVFTVNGGNKLVFVGNPNIATKPKLFIWDISSDKNINNSSPVTLEVNVSSLSGGFGFPISNDLFMCLTGNVAYKVNLSNSTITYKNIPSALPQSRKCAIQKEDGKIVFTNSPSLNEFYVYELDPVAFTMKKKSSNLGAAGQNKVVTYSDGEVFFIGGTTSVSRHEGSNSKFFLEKLAL